MATNKKDRFKNTLSNRKPTDEQILSGLDDLDNEVPKKVKVQEEVQEEGEKGFHVKLPISDFNMLTKVSKKSHIPKKYIIIQALRAYYKQEGYE